MGSAGVSETMVCKLNNGASMPAIGLGTWQAEKGLVGAAVKAALEVGYRHIDCASIYGNQKEVGAALQEVFKSGLVKRSDVWITSKLWCTDHDPEDVPKAMELTLQDLQLDYVDLYLIHWPVRLTKTTLREKLTENDFLPLDIPATWKAMEKLVEAGKAKAIGVSNFSSKKLNDVLSIAKIPPVVNQVECHPLWQQKKLREFCNSKGVHLSGYSPFGSTGKGVLENPVVEEVASKLGRTPAQVALRWGIQSGNSVLPKSTNVDRLKSNLHVFDFEIPAEEFVKFCNLPQLRVLDGSMWVNNASSPYKTTDELWDGEV